MAGGSPVERRLRRCRAEERLPRRGSGRGCRRPGPGPVGGPLLDPGSRGPFRPKLLRERLPRFGWWICRGRRLFAFVSRLRGSVSRKGRQNVPGLQPWKKTAHRPLSRGKNGRLAEPRFSQSLPRARTAAAAWGGAGKEGGGPGRAPRSLEEEARLAVPDQEPGGGKERAVGPGGLAGGRPPTALPALSLGRGELEPDSRGVLRWQL